MQRLVKYMLLLAVAVPVFSISWNWMNPKPTLNTIWDLETIPGGFSEIAVGERGTLLLSDDHWNTYRTCSYPEGYENTCFRGVCFTSRNTGYLCGSQGVVMKMSDTAKSWDVIFNAGQYQILTCVRFFDDNFGYVVGSAFDESGRIYRTTDGGMHWDTQSFHNSINAIEVLSAEEAVAVCSAGLVLKTVNAGIDWVEINTPTSSSLLDVDFISERNGIAVGRNATVLITHNGGKDWSEMNVPFGDDVIFRGINYVDCNNAVAVGNSGNDPVVIYTTNGGISWNRAGSTAPNYLTCVDYNSMTGYTAAGCWGSISSSQDNGQTWNSIFDSFYNHIREIVFADSVNGFCAGLDGFVAITNDGGSSWSRQRISSNDLFDIAAWNPDNAIVVGSDGFAAYTSNGGESWNTAVTPVSSADLNAVAYVESGKAVAVGDGGTIIISTDNGANWHFPGGSSAMIDNLKDVCFADSDNGFICGEGNVFLSTNNGGERWKYLPRHGAAGISMQSIDCLDCRTVYCAGAQHSIIKSNDGGVSWELLLSGRLGNWLAIDAANSSDIVACGQLGAACYSNDGGLTWSDAHIPTLAYLFSVHFSPENSTFYIAGHVGAMLFCDDILSSIGGSEENGVLSGSTPSADLISSTVSRNGEVVINLSCDDALNVRMGIVDLSGHLIADLGNRNVPAGESSILWDTCNMPAGVYLVFVKTGGNISSSKMVVF